MALRKKAKKAAKAAAAAKVAEAVADKAAEEGKGKKSKQAKQRKGLTFGRLVLLLTVGGIAALAVSEPLRSKVLDALFGAEEEFQYTPPATTTPAPTPTAPAA
jgi:hypothetical protein